MVIVIVVNTITIINSVGVGNQGLANRILAVDESFPNLSKWFYCFLLSLYFFDNKTKECLLDLTLLAQDLLSKPHFQGKQKRGEDEEEDLSRYWMTLRKREGTGN
jgi:hypothetical protein